MALRYQGRKLLRRLTKNQGPKTKIMIEIKKGIKMPKSRFQNKQRKYPWGEMEVGDCFDTGIRKNTGASYTTAGEKWALKHGRKMKFASRMVNGTIWIWRIK